MTAGLNIYRGLMARGHKKSLNEITCLNEDSIKNPHSALVNMLKVDFDKEGYSWKYVL